jgi:hypothetical protein
MGSFHACPRAYPEIVTDKPQRTTHRSPLPHPPEQGRLPTRPRIDPTDNCVQAEVPDYYEYTKLPIALDTIEVRSLNAELLHNTLITPLYSSLLKPSRLYPPPRP